MKQPNRTKGFTLVELLVVIGIIALLISILLPSLNRARETANRVKCAANLKGIGNALLMYSNDNKSAYPRTIYSAGTYPLVPTWGTGSSGGGFSNGAEGTARPYNNDVTSALYLLLLTQDITGDSFICPSSGLEKWDFGGGSNVASNWCNWNYQEGGTASGPKHLSYSYQNPYGDSPAVTAGFKLNANVTADFAVVADMNPGSLQPIEGFGSNSASDNVIEPLSTSNAATKKRANSNNHGKDGQNVLYGDGHVDWSQDAFAGAGNDNIYTRQDTTGKASDTTHPFSSSRVASDNVLLPAD